AHDYRIPVPLGLTDNQAGDLAQAMARFIANELTTPVSMGLHRDAKVDSLGNIKSKEKQGYHAHLYFPTRKLEEITGEDGSTAWALGAKFAELANKNTSGAFVEKLNEHWAGLANQFTADQGLTADYDHRSYARQELTITPQLTLGPAATAMERKGSGRVKAMPFAATSLCRRRSTRRCMRSCSRRSTNRPGRTLNGRR
ncbi:MAG: MobA/MobL family protein, partial [Thermoanaerobaculia bacterium]